MTIKRHILDCLFWMAVIALTLGCSPMKVEVAKVNTQVNTAVTYKSDSEYFPGMQYPVDGYGDCEDYAFMKMVLLSAKGIKSRIAYCRTETGTMHAVLLVDIKGTTYVLDNRYPNVWAKSKYDDWYKWK